MEAKRGASTRFNSGDGERGPGWFDVHGLLTRLQGRTGGRIRPILMPVNAAYPKWGLRVEIRMVGVGEPIAYGGYGTAYTAGSKTLAACYWLALTRAEEWLDAAGIVGMDDQDL